MRKRPYTFAVARPPHSFTAAVCALTKTIEVEAHGLDIIPTVVGKIVLAQITKDLKLVAGGCTHWLRGKRCFTCCTSDLPGADHVTIWERPDGSRVMISQPYGLDMDTLRELVAFCDANALDVQIEASSWHYPLHTLMVIVEPRSTLC